MFIKRNRQAVVFLLFSRGSVKCLRELYVIKKSFEKEEIYCRCDDKGQRRVVNWATLTRNLKSHRTTNNIFVPIHYIIVLISWSECERYRKIQSRKQQNLKNHLLECRFFIVDFFKQND
jgi:hypothetical protein